MSSHPLAETRYPFAKSRYPSVTVTRDNDEVGEHELKIELWAPHLTIYTVEHPRGHAFLSVYHDGAKIIRLLTSALHIYDVDTENGEKIKTMPTAAKTAFWMALQIDLKRTYGQKLNGRDSMIEYQDVTTCF